MKTVQGPLKVKSTPLESNPALTQIGGMCMSFEKTFEGALQATSIVSMMGLMNMEKKAGAYVALEKVTGILDGRRGSFCLYHSSSTDNGVNKQSIKVVPQSGTEELEDIDGSMEIDIREGIHSYIFQYDVKPNSSNAKS
ncbi:MAG: DUF3224 domain-containing protein [Proteobacteria bacterium]|nr:MAG: DUF3224 domain-containing protein [Pseudomonadota bacterium]